MLFILGLVVVSVLILKTVSVLEEKSYAEAESNQISESVQETEPTAPDILVREPDEIELQDLTDGVLSRDDLIQDIVRDAVAKPTGSPVLSSTSLRLTVNEFCA